MIYHNSRLIEYRSPFGAAKTGSNVHLQIKAEGAVSVLIRVWTDEDKETMVPMVNVGEGMFSAELTMPKEPTVLWYFFVVNFNDNTVCYGNNRNRFGGEGEVYVCEEPQSYQISVYDSFEVPEWYKKAIVYQIFPDRFARSEKACIPKEVLEGRKIEEWNTLPYYIKNEDGSIKEWNFWAGNLKGIEEKLSFISSLGATCIYLNPIFKARSNHRYDTADYMMIDPLLGTEEDFVSLCNAAEALGIKIILDGVFSHTGISSKYYEEHQNWYTGEYWWGVKDLPEVNETNPEFMEFICGEDGVIRHWLRLGAIGFRLDVADELPDAFIEAVRKAVKAEKEDAVLIGEVWEDASNKISYGSRRKFVLGRQLDGAMNYPLRADILDFTNLNIDAWEFAQRINSRLENYPKEAFWGNFNLIGSHDRERTLSVFEGDKEKLKIAAVLSYVLPGAPVIYYGDEAGLTGTADPDNRRSYPWGNEDSELIKFYTELGKKYNDCPALALGNLNIFAENKNTVVVERELEGTKVTIKIDALSKSYDII